MACCRCNRSGRCHNCLCVKDGRACLGCHPQRMGNCVNTVKTSPPQAVDMTSNSPSSPHFLPEPSTLLHPSNTLRTSLSPKTSPTSTSTILLSTQPLSPEKKPSSSLNSTDMLPTSLLPKAPLTGKSTTLLCPQPSSPEKSESNTVKRVPELCLNLGL